MLGLDDARWTQCKGGYRTFYDPRAALVQLELGKDCAAAWEELWDGLHHQGDVDLASYAAVPHLVRIHAQRGVADWNTYALLVVIEWERQAARNPEIPDWLREDYETAWQKAARLALVDLASGSGAELTRSALGLLAMARGQRVAGQALVYFSEEELHERLGEE